MKCGEYNLEKYNHPGLFINAISDELSAIQDNSLQKTYKKLKTFIPRVKSDILAISEENWEEKGWSVWYGSWNGEASVGDASGSAGLDLGGFVFWIDFLDVGLGSSSERTGLVVGMVSCSTWVVPDFPFRFKKPSDSLIVGLAM